MRGEGEGEGEGRGVTCCTMLTWLTAFGRPAAPAWMRFVCVLRAALMPSMACLGPGVSVRLRVRLRLRRSVRVGRWPGQGEGEGEG